MISAPASRRAVLLLVCLLAGSAVAGYDYPEPTQPNPQMERAPDNWQLELRVTTAPGQPTGRVVVNMVREWAPAGNDWVYTLTRRGYYTNNAVFDIEPGFIAQWGINGNPATSGPLLTTPINDEPERRDNRRGRLTMARGLGYHSRTTQLFVNLGDNRNRLDDQGFPALGEVTTGLELLDALRPAEPQPSQEEMYRRGDAYLTASFPNIPKLTAAVVGGGTGGGDGSDLVTPPTPTPPDNGEDNRQPVTPGDGAGTGAAAAAADSNSADAAPAPTGPIIGSVSAIIVLLVIVVIILFVRRRRKRRAAMAFTASAASMPPPGWLGATDPASGRKYFYHPTTKETRWADEAGKPAAATSAAAAASSAAAASTAAAAATATVATSATTSTGAAALATPPAGWSTAADPTSGRLYYYNPATGETKWAK